MLIWAGIAFLLCGAGAILIDRRAAHFLYDRVDQRAWRMLDSITHAAKAGHWLIIALVAWLAAWGSAALWGATRGTRLLGATSLAFLVSLVLGSAVLHGIKLVLGRRRPRDDIEMGLYGFIPLAFNLDYNSFPSGHALTIMCVAGIASCVWPGLWPLWFAIAAWLALTRALLTAHFLSDVLIGAGIGLIAVHLVVRHFFPALAPSWF